MEVALVSQVGTPRMVPTTADTEACHVTVAASCDPVNPRAFRSANSLRRRLTEVADERDRPAARCATDRDVSYRAAQFAVLVEAYGTELREMDSITVDTWEIRAEVERVVAIA